MTGNLGRSERIRSYSLTSGRTRSREPLLLETLVSTVGVRAADSAGLTPEQREICLACEEARSVTEIATALGMPLGVARILISDLAEQGRVAIHATVRRGRTANRELLERVLHGLEAIA